MNHCIFVGRLTATPELKRTDSGKVYTHFNLAITRPFRNATTDEFDTDFIRITCWEGLAEAITRHTTKGSMVCLKCRATSRVREVENTKVYVTDFIGETASFFAPSDNKASQELETEEM